MRRDPYTDAILKQESDPPPLKHPSHISEGPFLG
jgi:hypothetical protein